MTEKNNMLEELGRLETALADTYAMVAKVKDTLAATVTENTQLMLENDKLRARLNELESESTETQATSNMLELYNDGFHVCHAYYGKPLLEGESCLLCQEVLYR